MRKVISIIFIVELVSLCFMLFYKRVTQEDSNIILPFIGIFYLFWGSIGIVGVHIKNKIGLILSLNFQYLMLFACGVYFTVENEFSWRSLLWVIITIITLFSLLKLNGKEIRTFYSIRRSPVVQNILALTFMLFLIAFIFIFFMSTE